MRDDHTLAGELATEAGSGSWGCAPVSGSTTAGR